MAWFGLSGVLQKDEITGKYRLNFGNNIVELQQPLEVARSTDNKILGDIDFNGNTGLNVAAPTSNGQIANKEYADQKEDNAKTYADLVATDVLRYAGDWDASAGTYPTTGTGISGGVRRGDTYNISVEGTIDGNDYEVGDQLRAKQATPGQVTANWSSGQTNTQQATTTRVGISRMATSTEAKAKLSQTTTINPAALGDVITEEKKNVNYQINPIGVNEVSIYMENSGQVNSLILAGANTGKLKIGEAGTYPVGAQTYPFTYGVGDRVFVTFNYDNLLTASANVKLKCKDN